MWLMLSPQNHINPLALTIVHSFINYLFMNGKPTHSSSILCPLLAALWNKQIFQETYTEVYM